MIEIETPKNEIAICMPVYNEADGISEFLWDIHENFTDFNVKFFLVDDASTDDTSIVISELANELQINLVRNQKNLGHGPSTLIALNMGLKSGIANILSVDGDGQFYGNEMYKFLVQNIQGRFDVGIGARIRNNEPYYRRIASKATRLLVKFKINQKVIDANTPLRFYTHKSLESLLKEVD